MKIRVIHRYGDFPDLKPGQIIEDPSEQLLKVAQNSTCFEIIPDESPAVVGLQTRNGEPSAS